MTVTLCKITFKAFFWQSEWALKQDTQCLEGAQFCIFHFRRTATEKSLEKLRAGQRRPKPLEMTVTLCKITIQAFFRWYEWALPPDKHCLQRAQFCIFHFHRTATETSLKTLDAGDRTPEMLEMTVTLAKMISKASF
jgi:hypothetical protein